MGHQQYNTKYTKYNISSVLSRTDQRAVDKRLVGGVGRFIRQLRSPKVVALYGRDNLLLHEENQNIYRKQILHKV